MRCFRFTIPAYQLAGNAVLFERIFGKIEKVAGGIKFESLV